MWLMEHKKRMHEEKVTLCWNVDAGICDFGEFSCWFSHCEKESQPHSDCLKHKKQEHPNLVSYCKNETEGTCKVGNIRCCFKHIETKEKTVIVTHTK